MKKIMKNKKLTSLKLAALAMAFFLTSNAANATLSISSKDMRDGKDLNKNQVYNGFGCNGKNKSPRITISNIPQNTKSLAVTVYDPDAPTGSGWWHMIAYNISPNTTKISGKIEGATYGRNDYGTYDFGGACPPVGHGKHHYILTVYALGVEKLDVPKDASAALIGYNINANSIEKSSITSLYERK
jgi:Raf kinase inhibitor-like YbhB/YbcL family protein